LTLLANADYALEQFSRYRFFIISLALGFAAQIGLYIYLRSLIKGRCSSGKVLLVSGGASTTSMVSCCVHHLATVIPVIGATGFVSTISQYQTALYWIGLGFNAFGIVFIVSRIVKFRNVVKSSSVVLSVVALLVIPLLLISCSDNESISTVTGAVQLESQTNDEGPVSITVVPDNTSGSAATWDFTVALNTHSGSLDADLTLVSVLVADGKEYKPVSWDGDPPGGHHRRGILKFSPISPKPGSITLKIRQVGGVEERSFSWNF
jgi:hypothetical protein